MLSEHMQSVLTAADASLRAKAAEALARLGAEAQEAAVALTRASGDRDAEVRDWAVAALEDLGPPAIGDVPALTALVINPDQNIAYWACSLLGRLKHDSAGAVRALIETLANHGHLAVRERAAWALGQIGPAAREAKPALQKAEQSGEPRLARLAVAALVAISSKS